MVHWLEYDGIRGTAARESKQLEELRRYLNENPTAKAEGYWKTTGDMFAKFVRLECSQPYNDLDLECNSMSGRSLKRHAHKPSNIEYSEVLTQQIYGAELFDELPHEKGETNAMNENTEMTSGAANPANSAPLAENKYVQQLFSVLQENGRDTSGLSALLGHVSEMEAFVKRSEEKIADMRSQLAEMKEIQNHPLKKALQQSINILGNRVALVKLRLGELKQNIAEGCKSAVEAFREKGASALNGIAKFFHIKGALKAVDWDMEQSIKVCDRAVADINSFAAQYHSAGRAVKNMGRMLMGKEPIDTKKEAGKLAKAAAAPYKAQKVALSGIKKAVDKAITSLDGMEELQAAKARERQAERGGKPDILAKIEKNKERVEQQKREMPAPELAKAVGTEL